MSGRIYMCNLMFEVDLELDANLNGITETSSYEIKRAGSMMTGAGIGPLPLVPA